jgi:CrcB protein
MITNILMVGLGGGIGSMLRYGVQKVFQQQSPGAFPAATLFVNISGCFLIGLLWGWLIRSSGWNEGIKLLLMTGFCGGFTTFSAFTLEGIGLLKENKPGLFFLYVAASVVAGLLATYAGIRLSK